jgi:hypothetical protein
VVALKRAELFFRIYQLIDEHRESRAALTAEHGKVATGARRGAAASR